MEDLGGPSSSNRSGTRGRGRGRGYIGNNFIEGYNSRSRSRGTRPYPHRSAYPGRKELTNHKPALVGYHNSNDPSSSTSHPDDLIATSALSYGSPPRRTSKEYSKNNSASAPVDLPHSGHGYYEQKRTNPRKRKTSNRYRDSGYEPRIKQEQEQGPGPPDLQLHPSYPGSSQQRGRLSTGTGSISSSAPNSPNQQQNFNLSSTAVNAQTKSLLERLKNDGQQPQGPSLLERLKIKTEDVESDWGFSSRTSRWARGAEASGGSNKDIDGDEITSVQTNGHNINETDRDASADMVVSEDLEDLDQSQVCTLIHLLTTRFNPVLLSSEGKW